MTADGVAASVMVGIGETYLPAFVLAISSSQVACGLVSTVPMVIGAVLQLCAPGAIRRLGSYRRWVVLAAVAQAVAFLPCSWPPSSDRCRSPRFSSSWPSIGPRAWRAEQLGTPGPERWCPNASAPLFCLANPLHPVGSHGWVGSRGNYSGIGQGMGLAPRRLCRPLFDGHGEPGMFSAYFISLNTSQRPPTNPDCRGSASCSWRSASHSASRAILYMLAAQAACQIAGPYFNPYMLGQLKLSYVHYLILICTPYAGPGRLLACLGTCRRSPRALSGALAQRAVGRPLAGLVERLGLVQRSGGRSNLCRADLGRL